MKVHRFKESLKVGYKGEQAIIDYIRHLPHVVSINEVQNVTEYRKDDVDIIVTMLSGQTFQVEIKTDTYDTGNIFYETISCVETGSIGCMEKTKADFLFYYLIQTKELYILNMPRYREWFHRNKNKFTLKPVQNDGYTSEGYAVPKNILELSFKPYKKLILQ